MGNSEQEAWCLPMLKSGRILTREVTAVDMQRVLLPDAAAAAAAAADDDTTVKLQRGPQGRCRGCEWRRG